MVMRVVCLVIALLAGATQVVWAFCGFYVATGDERLINRASRVVLAHDGERTWVTMESDVQGDPREFGIVIPVPTVIQRDQVRLVRPETVTHLADYTRPRLVEYHDDDPCAPPRPPMMFVPAPQASRAMQRAAMPSGVRIEAAYEVGEYDIVVVSATNAPDLVRFLNGNGYRIPNGAEPVVRAYLRQGMRFFLAKVNMDRMRAQNTTGFLRPIQVEYRSPRFMLPIRLGTVNADGAQDMVVMALTRRGRLETANYRTVRMPTDAEVPYYLQQSGEFGRAYEAVFDRQYSRSSGNATFLEYAWDIAFCDPCSAPPMTVAELVELGARWLDEGQGAPGAGRGGRVAQRMPPPMGSGMFLTRFRVRYDREHFPEDLQLQETSDRQSFQVRFVTRRVFTGSTSCSRGREYVAALPARFATQAQTLSDLTGWPLEQVRQRMTETGQRPR